jgi:hypothetical protein
MTKTDRAIHLASWSLAIACASLILSLASVFHVIRLRADVAELDGTVAWLQCKEAFREHRGAISCLRAR